MNWRFYYSRWQEDYDFNTIAGSFAALLITTVFALYNGFLGIRHASVWHGSICVYYLFLVLIRCTILASERRARRLKGGRRRRLRSNIYLVCSVLLLFLNLCLIGPIMLMVKLQKPVGLTLIPAIAMAAYSFYKITIAAVNLRKRRKSSNSLVKLLRSVNFIDALMSIAVLQNTLIMVTDKGDKNGLLPLTATTSGLIWLGIVVLSIVNILNRDAGIPVRRRSTERRRYTE